jgi:nicotinamidase-related amidase
MLPHGPLPAGTVHLCVDMQNMFGDGSPWCTPWMKRVLPKAEALARARPDRTIFTRFVPPRRPEERSGTWRRYFERWREMTLDELEPQMVELVPSLAALAPPATVLDKPAYSPFHGTQLPAMLRDWRSDTVIVSGAETDVCVLAAVLDAVDLGLRVVIVRDAICSSSDETHDGLLALYQRRFSQQIEVAETSEILEAWSARE